MADHGVDGEIAIGAMGSKSIYVYELSETGKSGPAKTSSYEMYLRTTVWRLIRTMFMQDTLE